MLIRSLFLIARFVPTEITHRVGRDRGLHSKKIFLEILHLVARWLAPLPGSKKVLSSNLGLGAFRRGLCMFSQRLCDFHMFQSVFFTEAPMFWWCDPQDQQGVCRRDHYPDKLLEDAIGCRSCRHRLSSWF